MVRYALTRLGRFLPLRPFTHGMKSNFSSAAAAAAVSAEVPGSSCGIVSVDDIRNIGISAHIDSGKTTVTERILFYAGRIDSMHEVRGKDNVGATMDFMELERQRGITIQSAATYVDWLGKHLNIIDTPGHVDFTVEVERALRVLDGAILVLCGVAGVQSQTFTVNRQMARYDVPFLTFINKLDRKGASHHRALRGIRDDLGHNAAFMQLPIGLEDKLAGHVDLLDMEAVYFGGAQGLDIRRDEIPAEMRAEAQERREELIECVSGVDEPLGDLFLHEKLPTVDEIRAGIRRATIARQFTPVFVGSALKNRGVQTLLDAVVEYLPNPAEVKNYANQQLTKDSKVTKVEMSPARDGSKPLLALAFKLEAGKFGQLTYFRVYQGRMARGDTIYNTREGKKARVQRLVRIHASTLEEIDEAYAGDICATFGLDCASGDTFVAEANSKLAMESMYAPAPVISMSITPKSNKSADNFTKALRRFSKEDPTFLYEYDPESKETICRGMGELHLEIYSQRMKNEYNCEVDLGKPKVAFRESLVAPYKFDYKHKKQTGGQGQFGRVIGVIDPLPSDENTVNKFSDNTLSAVIPKNLMPAIKKGFLEACESGGPIIGQKITGLHMQLEDGDSHIVDSTEIAFINCAKLAMFNVYNFAKWQLLEPVMRVEATVPSEFQGPTTSAVSQRQGVIVKTDVVDNFYILTAEVPLNLMFGFTQQLRSLTQGKGEFTMEYSRYAPVSPSQMDAIMTDYAEVAEAAREEARKRAGLIS